MVELGDEGKESWIFFENKGKVRGNLITPFLFHLLGRV